MVIIGVVWIPVIQGMQGGQMYIYIQAISAYLAPPIAAVYLTAILWKRANESVRMFLFWLTRKVIIMRVHLCYNSDYLPVVRIINVQLFYNVYFVFCAGSLLGFDGGNGDWCCAYDHRLLLP